MTNEELLSVAEIVERATNRFNAQAVNFQERCNKYEKLMADMKAEHEAKMVEHRAAFGVRTEADAKIIAGLREESAKYKAERDDLYQREGIEQKRRMDVEDERNALRAEVAELKTQLERLTSWAVKNQAARETLQSEIERLKSQTPKQHPVKVGEWLRKTTDGLMYKAGECFRLTGYEMINGEIWCNLENGASWLMSVCEPCDPPEATHDTEAGKAAAKTVIRDSRSGEIEMCVGDEVEVIGRSVPTPTSGMFTGTIAPIGTRGTVKMIHGTAGFVELDNGTRASIQDVRKVTT